MAPGWCPTCEHSQAAHLVDVRQATAPTSPFTHRKHDQEAMPYALIWPAARTRSAHSNADRRRCAWGCSCGRTQGVCANRVLQRVPVLACPACPAACPSKHCTAASAAFEERKAPNLLRGTRSEQQYAVFQPWPPTSLLHYLQPLAASRCSHLHKLLAPHQP